MERCWFVQWCSMILILLSLATISTDCPYYKLEVLWRHGALGDVISNHTDVLSLYVCEMTCLDMDGCRGALYNSVDLTCFYYNSSDAYYDGSPDITFISRICNYTGWVFNIVFNILKRLTYNLYDFIKSV